ncbi:MAG TPA: hypothetical protein VJN96_15215 [Vicinamibacterales bacterium]|nr:hypothetical protein [Vicinamibacterales bacterium]
MEQTQAAPKSILVDDALANAIIEDLDRLEAGLDKIRRAVLKFMNAPAPTAVNEKPADTGGARVWDTSDEALLNYDAEQLVALRADHRADHHAPDGCPVCAILERRLGSL